MNRPNIPSYRRHRSKGRDRAFVEIAGRRHYLGQYGTSESRRRYHQLVARWIAGDRSLTGAKTHPLTVAELGRRFVDHARTYYRRPDGEATSEVHSYGRVLELLEKLYGDLSAAEVGPRALRAVRDRMISEGWCRRHVNKQTSRLRQVFKWGASHELIPGSVYHALATVPGLRKGRSEARESDPVRPVLDADVDAIRGHVSRQVWAMIELQRLTGMRPAEAVTMRGRDLDTSGKVWIYKPAHHKTAHHGHNRTVYLGPKAQKTLRPFLKPDLSAHLFSPADAEAERRAELHARRATPLSCGNRPGTNLKDVPSRSPGDRYSCDSYRRAIARACAAAGIDPAWSPNRLRHNAATFLRREYGIDLAQTILGHRLGSAITEVYAEVNAARAIDVMAKVG